MSHLPRTPVAAIVGGALVAGGTPTAVGPSIAAPPPTFSLPPEARPSVGPTAQSRPC